jgi:glycosyltransferase involved in cell wall biosynthesis
VRILHTESSCGWGGQELRILEESRGMTGRGHAVTIAAPAESRIFPEARARGLDAVDLPIARKRPGGIASLYRWLKHNRVDVINTHSSTDSWLAALACAMLMFREAPPIVRTRHISTSVPDNWATRWLYVSATRHVVTTGETLRRRLIEANGFPADRITSVPTGIDTLRFSPGDQAAARRALDLPPAATLIGIVATLRSWKGHRFLLDALAGIAPNDRDRDCILVIVGDGPQRANIESQIAELNIGDRVRMAGNQADVLPWLHALDIFALPSTANEGVPQGLVQAMLCGLPCVTTDVGSIGEAAVNAQTALVVAPQDAESLRQALLGLIEAPGLREQLGAAAAIRCRERFGFESMLDAMEAVFARVTASHGAERAGHGASRGAA